MGQHARRLSILRLQRRGLDSHDPAAQLLDAQMRHLEHLIATEGDGDLVMFADGQERWLPDGLAVSAVAPDPPKPATIGEQLRLLADSARHERAMGGADWD